MVHVTCNRCQTLGACPREVVISVGLAAVQITPSSSRSDADESGWLSRTTLLSAYAVIIPWMHRQTIKRYHFYVLNCFQSYMLLNVVNATLCFSIREKGAEDCKDLIDAFQACIKTLSEGS